VSLTVHYLLAVSAVGLMLFGLSTAARALARKRFSLTAQRRLVTVVESTVLGQSAVLHVVKAGARYYLIGAGSRSVCSLAEIAAEEVERWAGRRFG
jgi:flagellar biogenesis protein FliO